MANFIIELSDIEEELNKLNNSQCMIDSSLSKETLRESVKQIIVNHAGGYRIDYKNIWRDFIMKSLF